VNPQQNRSSQNFSRHHLRHAMANQLLNADAEVLSIKDLPGHNWISTTERYCRVSSVKVKRDYFNAMARIWDRSASKADSTTSKN
jgi:site-specific recombinase XerD